MIATVGFEEYVFKPIIHFVGFRGDEYVRACRIWGKPHYVHYVWDRRAQRDIADCDTVVFARGDADQPIRLYNGPDLIAERKRD